jgi:DNA polymerase-3 subunit delta'
VAMLSRCLAEGRVSHAYLFVGPAQVGKVTTARQFAQALNCLGEAPPCGECRACRLIAGDKHPDVEVMGIGGLCDEPEHRDHRSDGSREIRICQVRRIERVLSRTPFEGRYRVVIVDPADALTTEAANAFLKTLEEPPPQVVLILATEREEVLPPTVRSRCRRVPFAAASVAVVAEVLEERWSVPPKRAELLARLSRGRLGWALAALADEGVLEARESALEEAERLAQAGYAERFAFAAKLAAGYPRDPAGVLGTLETWQEWWRDVLLVAVGRSEQVTHLDQLDRLRPQASQYGVDGAVRALEALARVGGELEENASPMLALEVLMLEMPTPRRAAPAT